MCKHEMVNFIPCKESAGFPGLFCCAACGETFNFDPNNPKGVRYLATPNERQTKNLPAFKPSKA